MKKKSGVALTQLSLTLHYRRVFYYQFQIHVKSIFLCFIIDELPAFIVIVYIFELNFRILPECGCIDLIPNIK